MKTKYSTALFLPKKEALYKPLAVDMATNKNSKRLAKIIPLYRKETTPVKAAAIIVMFP